MTTQYYISWQVKKSNRVRAWYSSKMVATEAEARKMYDKKLEDARVIDLRLWQKDTYKPEEIENYSHPYDRVVFSNLMASNTRQY